MDNQPQPNSTAPDEHERVLITDYPGAPNALPLDTPPAQREIKQTEDDAPSHPSGGQHSPIGWLDRRIPHFAFSIEDGRLALTRNKWRTSLARLGRLLITIFWIFFSYDKLSRSASSPFNHANPQEIVAALFSRPNFDLVFYGVGLIFFTLAFITYVRDFIKFVQGKGDQLIFDHAANTYTRSEYPKMQPTHLSKIRQVNVDQQSSDYRVLLRLAAGGTVKVDTWYNEAEALYAGGVIAEYLSVPVTRTESPASVASGCAFTIAVFLVLFLVIALALWVGITFFHLSQST